MSKLAAEDTTGLGISPILLTVKEVSTLLRVQRPKVYELIHAGAIEGFKVGADWRIRRDSVEKLIGAIPLEFFDGIEDNIQQSELEERVGSPH
jgi:excisionase family DNA binding protein